MPVLLQKILTLLAMPVGIAALGGVLALAALARGRRRAAAGLVAFTTVWLWGWSTPFVAGCVAGPLVERYPHRPAAELPAADAIVLLGGDDGRVWRAAQLWHAGKAPLIIVTGSRWWGGSARPDAGILQIQLRALGIPDHAILIENGSHSTRQNAVFVEEVAVSRGIERVLLVTSAWHMPRAAATFGRTRLRVTQAAPRLRTRPPHWTLQIIPAASALGASTTALREYLGLAVYRVRGWM